MDRLRIALEDTGATYPVTVDPLLTETADTQLESDQASALLGISVAGAGDVNGDGYSDVIAGAGRRAAPSPRVPDPLRAPGVSDL